MIRSEELIDILVADLHFHHYMDVWEGDLYGNGNNRKDSPLYDLLSSWGINPDTSFYHGGTVIGNRKHDYLYEYIDDVFIDYFFRHHPFKPVVFPRELCRTQITPEGMVRPSADVTLNLQNIYDRCTFAHNMYLLFTMPSPLREMFPNNGFVKHHHISQDDFGLHGFCYLMRSKLPFQEEFTAYLDKYHPGRAVINPTFRMAEVIRYFKFAKETYYRDFLERLPLCFRGETLGFSMGYKEVRGSHIFGDYTIEDLLLLYSLLVDKCLLSEEALLLSLLYGVEDIEKTILMNFYHFEKNNTDYHLLDSSIQSKDLCLRFTSRKGSKAFTFTPINDAVESIRLFNQSPVRSVFLGNTMPLPYLYNHLNLL